MKFINPKMQQRYDRVRLGWAIEKVIRETLVIENKQSTYIAVDKIIDLLENKEKDWLDRVHPQT